MDNKKFFVVLNAIIVIIAPMIVISHILSFAGATVFISIGGFFLLLASFVNLLLARDPEGKWTPPVTIIDSISELTIEDVTGERATLTKTQTFKVNASNITKIIDRGLKADGRIIVKDAKCGELDVEVHPKVIERGEEGQLCFKFNDRPVKGKKYKRCLVLEYENSFLESEEYFSLRISRRVKNLRLIINVPPEREIKRAWLHYRDENSVVESPSRNIQLEETDGKRTRLVYQVRKPKIRSVHQVRWQW